MRFYRILIVGGILFLLISIYVLTLEMIGFLSLSISIFSVVLGLIWRKEDQKYFSFSRDENRMHHSQQYDQGERIEKKLDGLNEQEKWIQLNNKISNELKKEKFSKQNLLKKLDTPIRAILLQKGQEDNPKNKDDKIIKISVLGKIGFKCISNSRGWYLLPPSKLSPRIKDKETMVNWIKEKINKLLPEEYDYIFPSIVLIDLRYIGRINNHKLTKKNYQNILDVLDPEELIDWGKGVSYLENKKNLSMKDIINTLNFSFLCDGTNISSTNQEILNINSNFISQKLNKLCRKEILTEDVPEINNDNLKKVIKNYFYIGDKEIKIIKENATFWKNFLENKMISK